MENDQASAAAPLKLVTPRLSCHGSAAFRARSRAAPLKLGCQRLPTFPRRATPAIRKSLLLIGKCEMPRGKSLFPVGKCEMPRGKSLFPVGKCEMPRRKSLFLSGNAKCREGNRFSRREMRNPDREIAFPDRGRATLASASQQTISARDRAGPIGFSHWGGQPG